jgi:predicted AlkP superfamily phosphohydrolase/phosphomutase
MKNGRLIIIGLDGVPASLLRELAQSGIMPNTGRIIRDGFFTSMRSSVPEISSVAWSSIVSGVNPGEHGIFGFVDLKPDSYALRFPNFRDLKSPPFWKLAEGKSIIINVPSTYPVQSMNGAHISGFVSIDMHKSVYPLFLIPQLEDLGYKLDVDSEKAHKDMDLFLEDLDATLAARIRASEYLWDFMDWEIFLLAFTGTDRLMHFLWDAYEESYHRHHTAFLEHFRKIDAAIGTIYSRLKEDDIFIMLSDHGFERLEKDVYVNCLLAEEGFLARKPNAKPGSVEIESSTKAFALDPARIYLHIRGKYPEGGLDSADRNSCLKDLEGLFSSLHIEGRKVIRHIFRKEDIYAGSYLEDAPDLVLIAEQGFNLKGAMAYKGLTGKGPFTGKHTYQDAFFLTSHQSIGSTLPEDEPSVIDAGKLIKSIVA